MYGFVVMAWLLTPNYIAPFSSMEICNSAKIEYEKITMNSAICVRAK
jgi:hypothetical protein